MDIQNSLRYAAGVAAVGVFLSGCVSTPQQKSLSKAEEVTIESQVKQIRGIAETSLEISRNAEQLSREALEKSNQANATADKAFEASTKAIAAANEAREFAQKEADRAVAAANAASDKAVAAANAAAKTSIEHADQAAQRAVEAANEAVRRANESSERAIAAANQAIAEANRARATVRMAPPEEPILETEPAAGAAGKLYRVRSGDTLSSIAMKFYKDPSRWREIYAHNRGKIASPNRISPGIELVIP